MSTVARRPRRLAAVAAGIAAACALVVPAAAARAAAGNYTPSSNEWWLENWAVPQKVWPTTEGAGVTVAVLDTGVQSSVPDLRGAVEPGADMLGDSGNGEKDYAVGADGHGTAVSVLIAGQGYGTGTVGIAPLAKILPIHVLDPSTGMTPVDNGIKYAVDHGASVINLSLAASVYTPTTCDPAEQDAVAYALAHNVVVVAGSGDVNKSPGPQEPASCAGVLAVGGIEKNGSLWPDSTQEPYVSVAAPGDHMVYVGADGRYTTTGAGTSFSTPLVSGAAALIRSKYPSMPWYTVVQRLIDTAIPDGPVPNNGTGHGIINVNRAVNASAYPVKASAPNPVYAAYQAWLNTPDGQAFAQANHISTGQTPGSSTGQGGQPAPSAAAKSSSGGPSTLIIVLIVILVVAVGGVIALVQTSRNRIRRGPRYPGGPGSYPGSGYPPPGQQYPPPDQYPLGQDQYRR